MGEIFYVQRLPRVTPHDRYFVPLFIGMIVIAWLSLLLWDLSPYARFLEHDWTKLGFAASICAALPRGEAILPAFLFVTGWVLMTAAMMLPTTLPLVMIFRRMTARQSNSSGLLTLLLTGYLATWLFFGILAHGLGLLLLEVVQQSPWLTFNGWFIAALVLLMAGMFQFSSLKYRCLDACRSPLSFVASRWQGRRPALESLRLGFAHGLYCVGCCWVLMLLMFVVGAGSIAWMLLLGAVMALEKNSPWGRRLAMPVGGILIVVAAGITWQNLVL